MVGTCTTVPSDATPISAFARSTRADGMVSAAVGAIFAPLIHSTPAQGQQTCQLVRHQTRLLANSDHNDNNNDHNDNDNNDIDDNNDDDQIMSRFVDQARLTSMPGQCVGTHHG